MSQPIAHALQQVRSSIPPSLLQDTFAKVDCFNTVTTADTGIMNNIIQARVLPDCQILGGKVKPIPLISEYYEELASDPTNRNYPDGIYRIPPHARDWVDIVGVISIAVNAQYVPSVDNYYPTGGTTEHHLKHMVIDSHTMKSSPDLPIPELLDGNIIRLIPNPATTDNYLLNCRLAYDLNMLNLNPSAIIPFGRLVVLATKAHIYINNIVELDAVRVSRGQEIGVVKDIIDQYEDANELYNEELLKFRAGSLMDQKTKMQFIAHMV